MAAKTILVVFMSDANNEVTVKKKKKYSFNTDADLKVGDILYVPNYGKNVFVSMIADKAFKYYNISTGELTNEINSSNIFPIRTLSITDFPQESEEFVQAKVINRETEQAQELEITL